MKSFTLITGALLALSCALSLAQAGRYSQQSSGGYGGASNRKYSGNSNYKQHTSGYEAAVSQGYGNGLRPSGSYDGRQGSSNGPYHSYAVRPAIYGGHGMYSYRGYARYPPPPRAHYRPTRSYGSSMAKYEIKPIKAIALNYGQSNGGYNRGPRQQHYQAASSGYRPQNNGYRSNRSHNGGYNRKKRAYGGGASYRRPQSSEHAYAPSQSSSPSSYSSSASNGGYNGAGNRHGGYSQGRGYSAKKAASSAGGY